MISFSSSNRVHNIYIETEDNVFFSHVPFFLNVYQQREPHYDVSYISFLFFFFNSTFVAIFQTLQLLACHHFLPHAFP